MKGNLMKYRSSHHFTYADRIRLETMYNNGMSVKDISKRLPYCYQSIYREIKRGLYQHKNSDWTYSTKYSADIANRKATYNATAKGRLPKLGNDYAFVKCIEKLILKDGYSPAAALAYIRRNRLSFRTNVCLRTLYNYIDQGYFLHISMKNLPFRGKRKRKQKTSRACKRVARGTSIEERPNNILSRQEFGHWELDTIIGKREKGQTLLVFTERKTRYELIFRSPNKTALSTINCLNSIEKALGKDFKKVFRTITVDNGTEFSKYEHMEASNYDGLRTKIYYCHPFASGERGSNEKNNQMIRRKIPKGIRIETITDAEIKATAEWINNYPRALFNYSTSNELLQKELAKIGVKKFL